MITWVRGNLFDSEAEALVNTVNCVGVMGKGIAYQFKRAYPTMFKDYKARCDRKEITPGAMTTFSERGKLIINFPTKRHWRAKARLGDVERGLVALRSLVEAESIKSVAVPPLGCGNGGLDWSDVRACIARELGGLDDVEVEVFEPAGHFGSKVAREPRVSLGHFVIAGLRTGLIANKKIALQKAAYFFNVFVGEDYFKFTEHKFGPYFVGLDPMMRVITDYLDFTALQIDQMVDDGIGRRLPGTEADKLRDWRTTIHRTTDFVNRHAGGIEALATVHAVLATWGPLSQGELVARFLAWSPEKGERFNEHDVLAAASALVEEGLVEQDLLGWAVRPPPPLPASERRDPEAACLPGTDEPIGRSGDHRLGEQLTLGLG